MKNNLSLLREIAQRLGNASKGELSKETAKILQRKLYLLIWRLES